MKGEVIMMKIEYKQMGDYQIPQVALPKIKQMPQGRFSRMREKYLKEYKRGLYEELMLDGKMEEHLGEIEETAQKMLNLGEIEETAQKMLRDLIKSIAEKNKVDEKLKTHNQMEWVQEMNSIRNQAEEIIVRELIYN